MFIDEVKIHAKGGRGGDGVTAFARQPYEPKGPPDGGDGGHGGSIVLRASHDVASLVDYHHRPHRAAERGRNGSGDRRRGANGADEVLAVPVGTVVKDADDGTILADLVEPGAEYTASAGGRGGRGNAAFRTPRRRSPRFHEFGEPGQERWLTLELKLAADVALVGFPNAGKSSLVARLSAARPKIADYPFTTLTPNLGVVRHDDTDFVVADVPGLIEGASDGRGLGHAFLRHVERARMLVHVLDCASYEQRDPREDLEIITEELRTYQPDLLERPALVLLNKADADPDTAEIVRPDIERAGWEVIVGSAVSGQGMDRLRQRMAETVRRLRDEEPRRRPVERRSVRPVLRPAEPDFVVEQVDGSFRVTGPRIERWVAMTDLSNDQATDYLAQRLARAGVERALVAAGARRGDTIDLGGIAFDFDPEPGEVPDDESLGTEAPDDEAPGAETVDEGSDTAADGRRRP
jgi:GTPase